MEFGTVIQAGVAFGQVLGALSVVVVHFGTLSNLAAVTTRVGTFWESLERARAAPRGQGPLVELREGPDLSFLGVSLTLPNHPGPVIRDLTLALGPEDRLLVTGPSGSGKTSLLRLLGGLCSQGSGVLVHPPREQCMFIPQRPYMPLGSFRNQLLYGTGLDDVAEPELQRVIAVTGLEATVARVGRQAHDGDWKNLLSEGEQELFAFARVLLVRPSFLFLDEASNALGDVRRAILYAELQRLGIRYLTTGSRSQLDRFHNRVLTLETGGGWSVQDLPRLARSA
jgi:putative ATP-binding cassette transporter